MALVVAVHFDSGLPMKTSVVKKRAQSLRRVLTVLEAALTELHAANEKCLVFLGGDFNAVREEFVYGNTDEFYSCEGVCALKPDYLKPIGEHFCTRSLPCASLGDLGQLKLCCGGCESGELTEASWSRQEGADLTTRAGASKLIIDFVMVGVSTGGGLSCSTKPVIIPTAQQLTECSDLSDGLRKSAAHFGSDHLPVACDCTFTTMAP